MILIDELYQLLGCFAFLIADIARRFMQNGR